MSARKHWEKLLFLLIECRKSFGKAGAWPVSLHLACETEYDLNKYILFMDDFQDTQGHLTNNKIYKQCIKQKKLYTIIYKSSIRENKLF